MPTRSGAYTIAGDSGSVKILLTGVDAAAVEKGSFYEMVMEYARIFRGTYQKLYPEPEDWRPHCAFLFCGYSGDSPQIVRLSSENSFGIKTIDGAAFTGQEQHGGVPYLHHRLYSPGLSLESAKFLAYTVIAEVIDTCPAVGGPVEMAIVSESGVEPFGGFERYERKRQQIIGAVHSMIHSPNGISE